MTSPPSSTVLLSSLPKASSVVQLNDGTLIVAMPDSVSPLRVYSPISPPYLCPIPKYTERKITQLPAYQPPNNNNKNNDNSPPSSSSSSPSSPPSCSSGSPSSLSSPTPSPVPPPITIQSASCLALDPTDDSILFVLDGLNNKLYKIRSLRSIELLSDISNQLKSPCSIAIESRYKKLLIADTGNKRILVTGNGGRDEELLEPIEEVFFQKTNYDENNNNKIINNNNVNLSIIDGLETEFPQEMVDLIASYADNPGVVKELVSEKIGLEDTDNNKLSLLSSLSSSPSPPLLYSSFPVSVVHSHHKLWFAYCDFNERSVIIADRYAGNIIRKWQFNNNNNNNNNNNSNTSSSPNKGLKTDNTSNKFYHLSDQFDVAPLPWGLLFSACDDYLFMTDKINQCILRLSINEPSVQRSVSIVYGGIPNEILSSPTALSMDQSSQSIFILDENQLIRVPFSLLMDDKLIEKRMGKIKKSTENCRHQIMIDNEKHQKEIEARLIQMQKNHDGTYHYTGMKRWWCCH